MAYIWCVSELDCTLFHPVPLQHPLLPKFIQLSVRVIKPTDYNLQNRCSCVIIRDLALWLSSSYESQDVKDILSK